jgi:hypothetical protein
MNVIGGYVLTKNYVLTWEIGVLVLVLNANYDFNLIFSTLWFYPQLLN